MRSRYTAAGLVVGLLALVIAGSAPIAVAAGTDPLACPQLGSETVTTDKADYAPESTVHITGSGYAPSCVVQVEVSRPDGSVVKGDGSFTPGVDSVTTTPAGDLAYDYILDGILGLYTITVLGADDVELASTTFTDAPCAAIGAVQVGTTCELSGDFIVTGPGPVSVVLEDPLGTPLSLHIVAGGSITVPPGVTFNLGVPGPDGIVIDAGGLVTGNATTTSGVGATIRLLATGGPATVNGIVSSNQAAGSCTGGSAGTIRVGAIAGVTIDATGAITANGSPCSGGDILVSPGGDVTLVSGAVVSATQGGGSPGGATGGRIRILAGGDITAEAGSTIDVSAGPRPAGAIQIQAPNGTITLDGNVLSQSGMTGAGSPPVPGGGPISVVAGCDLTVTGIVSSRGLDPGADLVHLEGCNVAISGTVESTGAGHGPPGGVHCRETPANATGCVEVWAHGTLTITGEINADLCCAGGTDGTSWIDLFAAGNIVITGGTAPYAVHANENTGTGGNGSMGGIVTVKSVSGSVSTTGLAISANGVGGGGDGGTVVVESGSTTTVALDAASIQALGGTSGNQPTGGDISARSFNGAVTGTAPGTLNAAPAATGAVTLQGCTGVTYTGTSTPAFINPGVMCGGAPTLPAYVGTLEECPVCTPGSITIVKIADPEGPATFNFTASSTPPALPLVPANFTLQDNGDPNDGISNIQSYTGLAPGVYTFTENPTPGFVLDIQCSVISPRGATPNQVEVTLEENQDVICLFTNIQLGSITIMKDSVPDGPAQFSFAVTPDTVTPATFTLDDDGSPTPFSNSQVLDGIVTDTTYTVTETPVSGFALTAINCVGGQTVVDLANNQVAITFAAGNEIVCTFVNTALSSITIVKDAVPDGPGSFAFTASAPLTPASFTLDDDGVATNQFSNTQTFSGLAPGTYTITEAPASGFTLSPAACTGSTGVVQTARGVTITLAAGAQVVCTFVNTHDPAPPPRLPPPPPNLPMTGADLSTVGFAGIVCVGLGAVMALAGKRSRPRLAKMR